MRSLWASLLLLALIFSVAALDVLAMQRAITDMEKICEEMNGEGRVDAARASAVEDIFRQNRLLFSVSLQMETVDGMENSLLLLKNAAKTQSAADVSAALIALHYSLYRLKDGATPSLETIF